MDIRKVTCLGAWINAVPVRPSFSSNQNSDESKRNERKKARKRLGGILVASSLALAHSVCIAGLEIRGLASA